MKERFRIGWRVAVVMLLLFAMVPAILGGIAAAAADETNSPTLRSITWMDVGATLGVIDAGDTLIFYFSEAMLTSCLSDMTEVNSRLDTAAPGTWDYGTTATAIVWGLSDTALAVTLGTDCSQTLAGQTVNPAATVTDKAGNADGTASTGPAIPLPPDTQGPTLIDVNWEDSGGTAGVIDAGDRIAFYWSEAMDITTIVAPDVDLALTGGGTTYGAPGAITWFAGNTMQFVTLGAGVNIIGGETVDPAATVTDVKGNADVTSSPTITLPPDMIPPTLGAVGWNDDGNLILDTGDVAYFRFSESMDTGTIAAGTLDVDLAPSAGTWGTLVAGDLHWLDGDTLLAVDMPADVTVDPVGGVVTVNPAVTVTDKKGNLDNTVGGGPTMPAVQTGAWTQGETTRPSLLDVAWWDWDNSGTYTPGDNIDFYFSEAMQTSTLDQVGEINQRLDSSAPGTNDYGTTLAILGWGVGDTILTVTLGADENISGGETVSPASLITDKAGNTILSTPAVEIPKAPDTTQPTLLWIDWLDNTPGGVIDTGDALAFHFSEGMDLATVAALSVDADLPIFPGGTYGAAAAVAWDLGDGVFGTRCTVTLGALESIVGGEPVNPSVTVTDAKGNSDVTSSPTIPLPADSTGPTLESIVWNDVDNSLDINPGDELVFGFSEAMNSATILAAPGPNEANVVLKSTASGTDYGLAGTYTASWNTPIDTKVTVVLGPGETIVGGFETVNPTNAVTDSIGNSDATVGGGVVIPNVAGTPAAIGTSTGTMAFTAVVNGSNPADQLLGITNTGDQAMTWTLSKTEAWLSLNPTSGTDTGSITVSVNTSGMAVGTSNDTITITSPEATNSPQTVNVTVTVTDLTPTPTASPTPEASVTPAPTPTPEATAPPTPTPTPTPTPISTPTTSGSGTVGSSGGTVETADGVISITFPAGALTTSTTITITGGSCTHAAPTDYTLGNTCFSVTSSGASELGASATICVDYTDYDLNAAAGDTSQLKMGYYSGGAWTVLDTTVAGGLACAETDHLSDWAVLGGEGGFTWEWWHILMIALGGVIIIVAIILLITLPKRGDAELVEELYEEEEF